MTESYDLRMGTTEPLICGLSVVVDGLNTLIWLRPEFFAA